MIDLDATLAPGARAEGLRGRLVLVTGGAGFIGSHLVDALLAEGARVRVLDDFSSGRPENLAASREVELRIGDVCDAGACRAAAQGVEAVFHLAALGSVPRSLADPARSIAVNVGGTANVFAAARSAGVKRVVYASSSSVYGDSPEQPRRVGREGRPLSPYALSKWMGEELADVFARVDGLGFVGLRYFNVYGPRQRADGPYAAVVPRFLVAALAGEALAIDGDGGQSRDFTAVSDAVAATVAAWRAAEPGRAAVANVGSGRAATVGELAGLVADLVGGLPAPLHRPPRKGDVRESLAELGATRELLGWAPRVALEDGLALTLEAWRARG